MVRSVSRVSGWKHGILVLAAALAASPIAAQDAPANARGEVFAGAELERYLRTVQVAGGAPLYPWSVRGFGPDEVGRIAPADSAHPWHGRFELRRDTVGGLRVHAIAPRGQLLFNSAFPYGYNDGPVWAGRGVTAALDGGFAAEWGPLSLVVDPMVFVAQNAEFPLGDNHQTGDRAFADVRYPITIDLPQRPGNGRYTRVDPGQSTLRLDVRGVAAGVSTANQYWGPAYDFPVILGDNAPGYPHAFVGTARPANVWVGRIHARAAWGALEQSDYSPVPGTGRRFVSGVVATFVPRGVPGFEIGASRFFHNRWDGGRPPLSQFTAPFSVLFKGGLAGSGNDGSDVANQLASAFFRWVQPRAGLEVYGEYGRDDHNFDLRDLALEPDHISSFMLGARKVWRRDDGGLVALRGELMNARITHLERVRNQAPFYVHGGVVQGHTQAGQLLASPAEFAGAGGVVAVDWYRGRGRWTAEWRQLLTDASGEQRALSDLPIGTDVMHALGIETLLFSGSYEVTAGVTGVYELNRLFRSEDAFNLGTVLRVRRRL